MIKDRTAIMEKLQDIVREATDNEELVLHDETVATDVDGWDSLAQVLIIGTLQNTFGVKFTSSEVSKFANVGEFVDALMAKM